MRGICVSRKYYRYYYTKKYLNRVIDKKIDFRTASGIDNMTYKIFIRDKQDIISDIKHRVLSSSYKFTPYKELLILKGRNSLPRCVSIPTIKDKLCLRVLSELIVNYFSDIPKIVIPQNHVATIQRNIRNYDSYLKIDLKDFYGNINHDLLMKKIKRKIKSPHITKLIRDSIENPTGFGSEKNVKGIPQGIPTSNILAHIFLSDLDLKYSKKNNIMYCRYVDDILIFCEENNLNKIEREIRGELQNKEKYDLKLNDSKNKKGKIEDLSRNDPLNFLGYSFFKNSNIKGKPEYITSVKHEAKISIEKKIISLVNRFNKNKGTVNKNQILHELNRLITGSVSVQIDNELNKTKRFGWLFFYSQINDENLLWHLDAFVEKRIKKIIKNNPRLKDYIGELLSNRKTFVRTYYEIKYNFNNSNYFFNPDSYNLEMRRNFLKDVLDYSEDRLSKMDENQIKKDFKAYIYKKIRKDQQDLIKVTRFS